METGLHMEEIQTFVFGGYCGVFHNDNVPLSRVKPTGFVFSLTALGGLARCDIICLAVYKNKKDKI